MQSDKKQAVRRLKIISGQIEGLMKMIESDKYCLDILTQSRAIQNSLKSLDRNIIESHINSCVVDHFKTGKDNQAVSELLKIYSIDRK